MFLSEFTINLNRRAGRDLIASPQRLHAAVLGCFPPGLETAEEGRVLWRLDRGRIAPKLLVVSPAAPDFVGLNESAGWAQATHRSTPYDGFLARLREGQTWRFRLTANPTVAVGNPDDPKARSKRLAHVTASQQLEWLVRRQETMGVEFPEDEAGQVCVQTTERRRLDFRKGKAGHRVTISTAQFDGALVVRDPDALRATLTHGVGGAKAYGCGLLTLASQ